MKKIKMLFMGKEETFTITYQNATHIFCECETNSAARGFFTNEYVEKNKIS